MEQELQYLGHALESPERPFVAILGGAKVSDKIDVIENMLGKVDRLLIGGAMAYTFFKSRGVPIGRSLVEDDKLDAAKQIEADAAARGVRLELPVDHVVTDRVEAGAAHEVLAVGDARIGERFGVDIGPATIAAYAASIADAKTVVWNGPMGVFEIDAFAAGTNAVARAVAAVEGHDDHRRRRFDCGGEEGGDRGHGSRTSRPAAARRSSFSAGRSCRASPR